MDPATTERSDILAAARAEELELASLGGEEDDDDEDLDEDEDEDDEDEDEEDDEDDDVGTDEDGKEILRAQDDEPQAAPDVDSDRVPSTDAEPEGSLDHVKSAPLGIQEIENLENDARGG